METTSEPLTLLNFDAPLLNTTSWSGVYGDLGNLSTPWLFHDYSPLHLDIAQAFMDGLLTLSSPFTIVLIVLYALVFVVGLVGNAMVIWVIARYRNMRTVTNMFFVNLSVGDLLVVVVCMPFTLAPYVYKHWVFGEALCKISPFLQGTSVSVSVLTLLVVSLDRFYAISQPMRARVLMTRRRVYTSIVVIWMVAMALSLPLVFVMEVKVHGIHGIVSVATCEERWPQRRDKNLYNWSVFLLIYTAPLLVMTAAYAKISRVLWNGDHQLKAASHQDAGAVQQGRRRIIKMLLFVVITFAVSWLPYHVTNMYLDLSPDNTETAQVAMYVYPVCQWLGLANSSSNPICYCLMSRSFRHAFRSTCKCKRLCAGGSQDTAGNMSSTLDRHRNQYYTQVSTGGNSSTKSPERAVLFKVRACDKLDITQSSSRRSSCSSNASDTLAPNFHNAAAERLQLDSPLANGTTHSAAASKANGALAGKANESGCNSSSGSSSSLITLKLLANRARSPNIEIRVTDYSTGDELDATISWGSQQNKNIVCSVEDCEL